MQSAGQNYILGLPGSSNLGFGLIKLDTAGSVLWCKTYFRTSAFILIQMADNSDGSLTLLGTTNPKTTWNTPQSIFLMKVDSAGSFIWCKSYGDFFGSFYGGSYTMKRATDGGYIITAPITPLIRSGSDLMIIKTDSSGNLEWSRSHGEIGTNETSIDAFPTSDGGYFVVGTTDAGIPGSGYYIVKTDSLGFAGCQEYTDTLIVNNLTTDVSTSIIEIDEKDNPFNENLISVYPNPAANDLTIEYILGNAQMIKLELFNSNGILVKELVKERKSAGLNQLLLDITNLTAGAYFIKMHSESDVSNVKFEVVK